MTDYELLLKQTREFIETDPWYISVLSNVSALIMLSMENLNWAGFYIMRDGVLTVGPFQGKPACIHIPPGKGVCGTAVKEDKIQRVADVHTFPGHIACDAASRSEIVLPIRCDGKIVGVLDIDSPVAERFDQEDEKGLAKLADLIGQEVDFAGLRE